ncbi:MAG: T9SS type A sorting domain-containing protein [Ignavibacteria bacterium]|nr:T9SS type A sorting domain-containing protein [Ignavibacteria bacterium]
MKLTGAGSINIPTALAKGLAKTTEVNTSDRGKIIITDNSGTSYTLYTVKGEVNLNDYVLPPSPPAGMFDVRFGSGRYAEKLSTSDQTIELNSLEYPVKVRVDNADIRLQDQAGNGLNERMKSGEEVTISNSSINKLMVSGDIVPKVYSLEQNFPNPFNPSTKIRYTIPSNVKHQTSNVVLKVYDILGNELVTLVNDYRPAGAYEIEFNTSSISHQPSSGIYFYRLQSGDYAETKKMILLK